MSRRNIGIAGAVLLTAGVAWWALGGEDVDPREEIELVLARAADAAERKDLGGLMEVIGERFTGQGMDRDELRTFLLVQLRRGSWRRVFLVETTIDLGAGERPGSARVETSAVLASGGEVRSLEDVAGTDAGVYRLRLGMQREDDDWRVVTASWDRFGDDSRRRGGREGREGRGRRGR